MNNQSEGVTAAPFQEAVVSPAQQLLRERLRTDDHMFPLSDSSLGTGASSLSDIQALESEFRRWEISAFSARQQQQQKNLGMNQFPLDGRDQGMNGSAYWFPSNSQQETEREQINQSQRLWFPKDNGFNKLYNYDFHERYQDTSLNGNLGDVPFIPSNPFFDQIPMGFGHGYMSEILTNHDSLLSRAKDRIESHWLQDLIAKGSRVTVDKIFDNLISHVSELMLDPFGHQVFRQLLEKCTDEQITRILNVVIQQPLQFVRICVDLHGNCAIQDLMRCLCSEEQMSRFMAMLCHVAVPLTKSVNANFVILFCFNHFPLPHSRYLLEVIVQNCYQVATDQHGCFMLQHCMGISSRQIRDPLIKEIINDALRLSVNSYGNYVVQYVLELEDWQVAAAISRHLDGNYVQLSCDKYGSHAVQKCLKNRVFSSRRIITELLRDIDLLLVNPFGNYVIQTAWIVSKDDVRNVLLYHINKNAPLMRCNRYGRKVLEKLNLWT